MKTLIATTALVVLSACQAVAGPNCAPRQMVVDRLASKYKETRQSIGLGANNSVVEVFASDDSGSWTIITTAASGLTCVLASGQSFEVVSEPLLDDPA